VSKQKFVIVAARRTGSNLLCTLLNSHPEILCHHEVFNPRGIFYALDFRNGSLDLGSHKDRDADPMGFLKHLWNIPTDSKCVGFKMTRGQAERVLEKIIIDPEIKKVILRRRNRVKTFVSELIAEKTDQWELYCHEEKIEPPKVRVEFPQLLNHAAQNNAFYNTILRSLEASNQPHISLEYECITSVLEQQRILEFLGLSLPYSRLFSVSIKQTPTDLRAVVSNFSELDSTLSETDYHQELHDLGP